MNDVTRNEIKSSLALAIQALQAVAVALDVEEPAAVAAPAPAPAEEVPFVEWIRTTAEARKARKSSNADMAAWMRSKGLVPNGSAWEACKKGERNVRTLKALNAADAKAKA